LDPGLISVLVTVRDGEPFVATALDSLLAQTDDWFEVVVVDDGSTDGTWEIVSRYIADSRVRADRLSPVGRVAALLRAVRLARGDCLAFLDADDVALSHRLATQRAYLLAHPQVALVGARALDWDGTAERPIPAPTGPAAVRRALGMYNPVPFSSVVVRRTAYEAVGGFRSEDGWGYDKAFLVRVATRFPIDVLPDPLVRYRRHPGQVSRSPEWERQQRRRSADLQLWAARELGLPAPLWVFPLLGWVYSRLPPALRPRALKRIAKRALLRLLRVV
jgi:glycosyltransferase involved in cell wall biosynthesis